MNLDEYTNMMLSCSDSDDIARVGSVTVELGGDDKEVSPFINCEGVDSLTCTTCQGSGIQPRYLDRRYESNNHVPYTPDSQ
uniref:Transmembrane protein 106 N-terminal domain-containing protein n=1 Tax=Salix viminalis TaxID=40686 RepID=A0A6N2MRF4_SALVM